MGNYQLEKTAEIIGFKSKIPEIYPLDLTECMLVFEKIKYQSYGFGMVFLDFNYTLGYWSVAFRNPSNFTNPNIQTETPIEAVHEMFDFLKTLK